VQPVVTTRELRRDILDLAARASQGEAIVVMRHGRPVALLRRARPEENMREVGNESFRRHIAQSLRQAERRPHLITWHGRESVVLAPLPPELADVEPDCEEEL
jgi:antitoxin (DNA-binding transcriptional repressor) of toxin-antitoxin stability system